MKILFSVLLLGFLFNGYPAVLSQQPTQEWVSRYSGISSQGSNGLSVKLDSSGDIYVLTRVSTDTTFSDYCVIKYSSSGSFLWQAVYNSPGNLDEQPKAFTVTGAGDIYITGIIGINFAYHILTVKFNSSGVFQWAKIYDGGGIGDGVYGIALDNQHNIVITGSTAVDNDIIHALTIKYNSNGDSLWARKFNQYQQNVNNNLVIDDSGSVYTAGYCVPSVNKSYFLILKYNSNGSLYWHTTYFYDPGYQQDLAYCITIDTNGYIYVAGISWTLIQGFKDNSLLKLSTNGNIQWSRVYKGIGENNLVRPPKDVSVTPDGSAVYYTTFCTNEIGGTDIVTIKYNPSGDSVWVRRFGGGVFGKTNEPSKLKLDRHFNVYVTGNVNYSVSGDDYVTIKYLPNGTQQWVASYNGPLENSFDYANDLIIDSNLIYVTGISSRQSSPIRWDAATIKYNQPIGIISNNNGLPKNCILHQNYPNPFNSLTVLSYEIPKRSFVQLKVYNSVGQLVKILTDQEQESSYYSINLNSDDLASGIYFYMLKVNSKIIDTKKIIIVK